MAKLEFGHAKDKSMNYRVDCPLCAAHAVVSTRHGEIVALEVEINLIATSCPVLRGELQAKALSSSPFCPELEAAIRAADG
jgi:hypothetical protein